MGFGGKGGSTKQMARFTLADVAKHNAPHDAWLVIHGKVYDVSNWADHPGGSLIFTHAGLDATNVFRGFHPASAHDALAPFLIGTVESDTDDLETDFRALHAIVRKEGLQKASAWYYVMKLLTNALLLAAAVALATLSASIVAHFCSAVVLALFWQQCGWLSHDFLHHQVFGNRVWGNIVGYIIGNAGQGFSVSWWKEKHNTHHAVPNVLASHESAHNGDPDIDTAPLLTWSSRLAAQVVSSGKAGSFFLRHQAVLYFPILFVARVSWLLQSLLHVLGYRGHPWGDRYSIDTVQRPGVELTTLALYYFWNSWILCQMPVLHAILYVIVSQTVCGLFLAVAFGVGHNGMTVYPFTNRPHFLPLQVTTTRNVHDSLLVGWFMGGLQYQIEHHICPDVPRHHLPALSKHVQALCRKHHIPYHSTSLLQGSVEVLSHLKSVTEAVIREFPGL